MKKLKIKRNMIQCRKCGDIIESKFKLDIQQCSCGACAVYGGHERLDRILKTFDSRIDLSEYEYEDDSGT